MTISGKAQPLASPVTVNELPLYSPWPARLLQAPAGVSRSKDRQNVLREFNDEKWGSLLAQLPHTISPDLALLERLIAPPAEQRLYSYRGELYRAPADVVQQVYLANLIDLVGQAGSAPCIGELGAGAGNLLLHLARYTRLADLWVSYELTENGRRITDLVAATESLPVTTCMVDFDQPFTRRAMGATVRSAYYSSFALAYCRDPYLFLASLLDQHPLHILLVEPIFQFFDETTLVGLLARRYFEYNDYSSGLLPAIERLESEGRIRVEKIDRNFFGHNPLCPVSALHLVPAPCS